MPQTIVATSRPAYQAYQILYVGFIVAPFLAGLDKFTHILTDWIGISLRWSPECCRSLFIRSCSSSGSWR
jgi:hypothetical protein